jgi:RNA ligase (TIGR02306 family)
MRKLASIRRISEIKPIDGADAIEAVRVDGWWVVSKKGEFKVDDMCVYFEVDSFLPVRPEFEFLRKACFRSTRHLGDGFRLKTIKLRGQISQGLVLPLDTIATLDGRFYQWYLPNASDSNDYLKEGDDVTEFLGVQKWELPLSPQLAGKAKGNFPSFLKKTDQERIQNCYGQMQRDHSNKLFEATLKLDGSSMTVYLKDGVFGVCSRNLDLQETEDNTFWKVARKNKFEEMLRAYGKNVAIQGELMGPGIQGNRENLPDHEFFLFDVWDIDRHEYYTVMERLDFVEDCRDLGFTIRVVPYLGLHAIMTHTLDGILAMSEVESISHPVAEGVVYRSYEDGSVSFKAINNKFLLQEK